jgi:hypothetical protein
MVAEPGMVAPVAKVVKAVKEVGKALSATGSLLGK